MKKRISKAKPAKPAKPAKSTKSAKRPSAKRSSAKRPAKSPTKALQIQLPANASAADRREAAHFVETLEANKQLSREPGRLPPGATHQVERDQSGNERLVRKRFSAF